MFCHLSFTKEWNVATNVQRDGFLDLHANFVHVVDLVVVALIKGGSMENNLTWGKHGLLWRPFENQHCYYEIHHFH